jgi:hypothetical protein
MKGRTGFDRRHLLTFGLHGYVAAFGFAFPLQIATSCGVALGALFPRLFGLPAVLACIVLQMLI